MLSRRARARPVSARSSAVSRPQMRSQCSGGVEMLPDLQRAIRRWVRSDQWSGASRRPSRHLPSARAAVAGGPTAKRSIRLRRACGSSGSSSDRSAASANTSSADDLRQTSDALVAAFSQPPHLLVIQPGAWSSFSTMRSRLEPPNGATDPPRFLLAQRTSEGEALSSADAPTRRARLTDLASPPLRLVRNRYRFRKARHVSAGVVDARRRGTSTNLRRTARRASSTDHQPTRRTGRGPSA